MTYYSVPDPAGAATYSTDSDYRVFMGDRLVEYRWDGITSELWQIGDTSTLYDAPDQVLIASTPTTDGGASELIATADQTLVYLFTPAYWVVDADGSNAITAETPAILLNVDQRLESTFRAYAWDGNFPDQGLTLTSLPSEAPVRALTVDGDTENSDADLWAGFVLGDVSTEQVQPTPPDPFDEPQTAHGLHTFIDHGLVFTRWNPADDPKFNAWVGSVINYHIGAGYIGDPPSIGLGFFGGANVLTAIPPDTDTALPDDTASVNAYRAAYAISPGGTPHVAGGALYLFAAADPGVPADVLDFIEVSISGTIEVDPSPAHAYRRGQYRFTDQLVDDVSAYPPDELPGTEYMEADFIEVDCDRWVAVIAVLQDADNYGGDAQLTVTLYHEDICTSLTPLRLYPRGDDLGVAPSPRNYPAPKWPTRNYSHEPTY